jgi:hypothetical protein
MAREKRTTKALASRIELTYYKHPHPLRTWRARLAIAATLAPALLLSGLAIAGDDGPYSPGPLSSAHAPFASQCDRCHTSWHGFEQAPAGLDAARKTSKCSACHLGSEHAKEERVADCQECHREHVGRSLIRPDDVRCTDCHGQPSARAWSRPSLVVSGFSPGRHPEFAALAAAVKADSSKIFFEHEEHLGKPLEPTGETLDCLCCHRPEGPDLRGRSMQPIEYARDCKRCHELELDGRLKGVVIRHGEPLARLRTELAARAAAREIESGDKEEPGARALLLPGELERQRRLEDARARRASCRDGFKRRRVSDEDALLRMPSARSSRDRARRRPEPSRSHRSRDAGSRGVRSPDAPAVRVRDLPRRRTHEP